LSTASHASRVPVPASVGVAGRRRCPEFGDYLSLGRWQLGTLSTELIFCRKGDLLTSLSMTGMIKLGQMDTRLL
jgi:hypothetical protein